MTTNLSNVHVDEISILSKDVRPAVRAARIAITKKEFPDERADQLSDAGGGDGPPAQGPRHEWR